jgi:predicted ferric reductase
MAPRNPDPLPDAIPFPQPIASPDVTDFGLELNLSAAAAPFSHGLRGVNQNLNYLLANVLVMSFMALMAGTLLYRWVQMGHRHLRHLFTMGQERDQRYFMHNHTRLWPWMKRHVLYAPFWKVRHNREFTLWQKQVTMGTLPSRFHSVLLLVYLVSNAAYCAALDYTQGTPAIIAEFRGRTGVLAALNIIPTILFALRNNPGIPLLKVPYDTFNLLHRWCARIVVIESVLHTIAWAVNAYRAGGSKQIGTSLNTSVSYQWGLIATAVFVYVAIASSGPVRHHFYEFFLNSHRLLAVVAIAGVYVHLDKANLPMLPYVQLSLAFWAAEIAFRTSRIIYHNVSRKKGLTKVTVEWLPAETCRITYHIARPWKWRPGCHVHAYIPTVALWSSHPFSVAWAENRQRHPGPTSDIEMEKLPPVHTGIFSHQQRYSLAQIHSRKSVTMAEMATVAEVTHKPEETNITLPGDSRVTSISLVVRAREGMTRKLYERLEKNDRQPITTWGLMEGPYGGHDSLSSYGTVLLFAGGIGITHCIGYIYHLLSQYQAGTCSTRKILLVWSVPNTECLEWIRIWMDQILKMEGRREVLKIQLFVTKPRHRGEVVSSTGSVQMFPGRCKPKAVIEKEMPDRIGSVAVTVCGPGALADDVRAACRSVVTEASLDFIEEAFTY